MARQKTRWVVAVPFVPYLLGRGLRGLIVLALAVSVVVMALAWPLVVFTTTKTIPQHCVPGIFGPDCTPVTTTYGPPTATGWLVELVWIGAMVLAVRAWKNHGKPKAARPARTVPVKAKPGPRDYNLAPPVGMGK